MESSNAPGEEVDSEPSRVQQMVQVITETLDWVDDVQDQTEGSEICYAKIALKESTEPSVCMDGWTLYGTTCVPDADNGGDCAPACGDKLGQLCPAFCPPSKPVCCSNPSKSSLPSLPACQSAQFVDFSFTVGSSSQYYQCISPAGSFDEAQSLAEVSRSSSQRRESGGGWGSYPAQCDLASKYSILINGVCYGPCPSGTKSIEIEADGETYESENCQQECAGEKDKPGFLTMGPVTLYAVCTQAEAYITSANVDIMTKLIAALTKLIEVASSPNQIEFETVLEEQIAVLAAPYTHFLRPECE